MFVFWEHIVDDLLPLTAQRISTDRISLGQIGDNKLAASATCISSWGSKGEIEFHWTWSFILPCSDCFSKLFQYLQLRWKCGCLIAGDCSVFIRLRDPGIPIRVWKLHALGEAEYQIFSGCLKLSIAQGKIPCFSSFLELTTSSESSDSSEKYDLAYLYGQQELFYWSVVENLLEIM